MAWELPLLQVSGPAAEDLTAAQFNFGGRNADGSFRRPDNETEICEGVLQTAPGSGATAVVMVAGFSKVQANDALGVGSFIKAEFVAAADAGKAKDAAADLAHARGMVVYASGAEDDLLTAWLLGPVPAITQVAWERYTVTTDATAGAKTYTAAELLGRLILRDPNGGNRNDVSPAAAAIVAAIQGCVAGSGFQFTITNTADAAETITLTAGAGITLSGTMTIAQANSKRFLAVVTNAGAGVEAVTIYSLGTVVY